MPTSGPGPGLSSRYLGGGSSCDSRPWKHGPGLGERVPVGRQCGARTRLRCPRGQTAVPGPGRACCHRTPPTLPGRPVAENERPGLPRLSFWEAACAPLKRHLRNWKRFVSGRHRPCQGDLRGQSGLVHESSPPALPNKWQSRIPLPLCSQNGEFRPGTGATGGERGVRTSQRGAEPRSALSWLRLRPSGPCTDGCPVLGNPRGRGWRREAQRGAEPSQGRGAGQVCARSRTQAPRAFATSLLPHGEGRPFCARPQGGRTRKGGSRQAPACCRQSKVQATSERPSTTHSSAGADSARRAPSGSAVSLSEVLKRAPCTWPSSGRRPPFSHGRLRIPVPPPPPWTHKASSPALLAILVFSFLGLKSRYVRPNEKSTVLLMFEGGVQGHWLPSPLPVPAPTAYFLPLGMRLSRDLSGLGSHRACPVAGSCHAPRHFRASSGV